MDQSVARSNANEEVLNIPENSKTRTSPSDGWMS